MLVKWPAMYPEPDQDDKLREALFLEPVRNENALPAVSSHKEVLFCPLPGQVQHLKCWLTKYFADHEEMFQIYAGMGSDERTEMQIKFQDSRNPSEYVTTLNVGGTGLNVTAANHAVRIQKFWVLNEQRQEFVWVMWLGQNQVPYTWLLKMGPGGYDNRLIDLYQLSGITQMRVLHSLMSRPNIRMTMIYQILESRKDHMKWPTENRVMVQSDEPSILDCLDDSTR